MARQRGFRPVGARSRRRATAWDAGPGGTDSVTISATGSFFLGSAVSLIAGVSEVTLVRLRGQLDMFVTGISAVGSGFQGAIGIGLASTAAVTAGIASVPTPITEMDAENWLFHSIVGVHVLTTTLTDGVNAQVANQTLVVDSKAMRKFTDEQSLYAVLEVVEVSTSSMIVHFDSRILSKLV